MSAVSNPPPIPSQRILCLCLGNICRSPLAEVILKRAVRARGLDWHIESRGTSDEEAGNGADYRSVKIAKKVCSFMPYHHLHCWHSCI